MVREACPDGWVVWSDSDDRTVFTYRPDTFDSSRFPAPCLPTLYLARGVRQRRPGVDLTPHADAHWELTLYLEPDVRLASERVDDRETAVREAVDLMARFATGKIDYRAAYQVLEGREEYLVMLDTLTGRDA